MLISLQLIAAACGRDRKTLCKTFLHISLLRGYFVHINIDCYNFVGNQTAANVCNCNIHLTSILVSLIIFMRLMKTILSAEE
jgi:hypothetical protein